MINLLVVTSDAAFGELIRQNLGEMGRFQAHLAWNVESAVACVQKEDFPLAFLDTSLAEADLLEIGNRLRQVNPKLRFVILSKVGWQPSFEELSPEQYLSKPFYLPSLRGMMDNLFPNQQSSENTLHSEEQGSEPPWLSDVTRAAQHLTRLTLESSAQAALITRNDQLWAYAGQLPQSSTSELTDTVSRYWDRQKENDLVRFVRLASTGAEHMLYATRLTQNMVLALIFDAETPFGTIHTQANQLVHSLAASPSEKQEAIQESDDDEAPSAPISDILSDIPSPNPGMETETAGLNNLKEGDPAISLPPARFPYFNRPASPAMPINTLPPTQEADPEIDLEKTVPSPTTPRKSWFRKDNAAQGDPEATHPTSSIGESVRKIVLEPVSPSVFNLDYACLLIPRFPQHHLIGDLSECLTGWVQENCIAYDWRLEYIAVRPDYLLWIVSMPPAGSPAYLMRIMIQRTSVKIFETFPRFKKENPSGNFWASAFLIMGRSQPPQAQLIKEFIAQTRQQQGINPQLH